MSRRNNMKTSHKANKEKLAWVKGFNVRMKKPLQIGRYVCFSRQDIYDIYITQNVVPVVNKFNQTHT